MKKFIFLVTILFSSLLFSEGFKSFSMPQKKNSFLKPSEAFNVKATQNSNGLKVDIGLADKIHIYKNKLSVKITKPINKELSLKLPKAKIITGEEAFDKNLSIFIPNKELGVSGDYEVTVGLQGCSDAGICYSPQQYKFKLKAKNNLTSSSKNINTTTSKISNSENLDEKNKESFWDKIVRLAKDGNSKAIAQALQDEGVIFIVSLFFIFGLLLSLTPCILPMIPILSSILLQQAGKNKEGISRLTSFTISLVYVVSMSITYAIIGIVAGLLHFDLQANLNNLWVIIPVAAIFIALALSLFGYFEIALPQSLQTKLTGISNNQQGKGLLGTAIMGAISALIVGACTAPVISGAILFISFTGNAWLGALALFVMGLGAGVPLLLVGLGAKNLIPKPGGWMENVSRFFGVLMLLMALYIARGVISPTLYIYLFSFILIGTALGFGVFNTQNIKGIGVIFKTILFVILLYGSILFIGAISGSTSILNPLEKFEGSKSVEKKESFLPEPKSYTLKSLLEEIKNAGKPVVVDIGKENCAACTELANVTFPDPKVKNELKRFKVIRLDTTNYTKDDQDIMNHFNIFGAPNILIFDSKGKALEDKFMQGFVDPITFSKTLKEVK